MTTEHLPAAVTDRLSVRERIGYGAGDLASGLVWQSVGLFLMYFYTDVFGIAAAAAGTLLFVARAWDAVWDVFLGFMVDRTRSRWGRCRPYLLFGAPLLAVTAYLTYTVPPLEAHGKLVYAYATYILLMMAYSTVNIPYSALPALLSGDPAERTRLAGYRMFFAFTGALLVSAGTLSLVELLGAGDKGLGYQRTVGLMGVLAVLLLWLCFGMTRERVQTVVVPRGDWRADARALLGSRTWWPLFLASLVQFTASAMANAVGMYFLIYVVGHKDWASTYFVVGTLGMLAGVLISSRLTARFCKRRVVILTTFVTALLYLSLHGLDLGSRLQVHAWMFLVSASGAIKSPIIWSMVADTADDTELRSGRSVIGLTTSSVAFATKFGIGIGAGLAGVILAEVGYVAGAAQSAQAQQGILGIITYVPATGFLILSLLYGLYPLDRGRLAANTAALVELRAR